METMQAMELRKSCRDYLAQEVEEAKLKQILRAIDYAPGFSAFRVTVIRGRELLRLIDDATFDAMLNGDEFSKGMANQPGYRPLYNAPVLIVLSVPGPMVEASAACAVTAMTIAAADIGLGSCYVRAPMQVLAPGSPLGTRLNNPDGYYASDGMLLGYCAGEKFAQQRLTPVIEYLN